MLWPECGWQPVSLTDMITAASVKKVYRKATLCIHPDKVQQKGANLQQKYIAEKVFDLLKVYDHLPLNRRQFKTLCIMYKFWLVHHVFCEYLKFSEISSKEFYFTSLYPEMILLIQKISSKKFTY